MKDNDKKTWYKILNILKYPEELKLILYWQRKSRLKIIWLQLNRSWCSRVIIELLRTLKTVEINAVRLFINATVSLYFVNISF